MCTFLLGLLLVVEWLGHRICTSSVLVHIVQPDSLPKGYMLSQLCMNSSITIPALLGAVQLYLLVVLI